MSYNLEITIGENETELQIQIDAQVVENGFDHEFGFESCLDIEWDEVESIEMVTKSTFTGINKYTKQCEYDIETKAINFDKLRKVNQDRITEEINSHLESVDTRDFINDQREF